MWEREKGMGIDDRTNEHYIILVWRFRLRMLLRSLGFLFLVSHWTLSPPHFCEVEQLFRESQQPKKWYVLRSGGKS